MPPSTSSPIVALADGAVRGVRHGPSSRFLGIPFAEPPVGALRFAGPLPVHPWSGVLDATRHGATAQRSQLAEVTTIPEPSIPGDSVLNVDVSTPDPSARGLPVLVWIHGGGYTSGSPASPWYDGASFTRDGMVTVVVSYRLGFEGFGWIDGAVNNRGVLDWLAALRWVQRNISVFGGDPARVTIAGQSAGGGAVLTLLAMPDAQGLFQKAVSLSGAPADIPVDRAREVASGIADVLGIPDDLAGWRSTDPTRVHASQGSLMAPPSDLDGKLASLHEFATRGLRFGPVVDGRLVRSSVTDGLAAGVGRAVPLLLGATQDEFTNSLAAVSSELDALEPAEALRRLGMTRNEAHEYAAALTGSRTTTTVGRLLADRLFRARVLDVVEARPDAPTWTYDFAWPSAVTGMATHCLDLPFFFDLLADPDARRVTGTAPQALADAMHGALIRFIREGDPGWQRAGTSAGAAMSFDAVIGVEEDAYASASLVRRTAAERPHSRFPVSARTGLRGSLS